MTDPLTAPFAAAFDAIARLDVGAGHDEAMRKQQGITYTRPALAQAMVAWLDPAPTETIHEPSCGRGVFLVALAAHWLGRGYTPAWVDAWASTHLRACDLDAGAVADAKRIWHDLMQALGVAHPHPLQAKCDDGLAENAGPVDVIVGNPPYVRFQNLPEEVRARLQARYPTCRSGNVDLYYAFFEDALNRAQRVCYIMPNSWLRNVSAKALRRLVRPRLQGLMDFGSRLMFAPVRAYTAIVLCGPADAATPDIAVRHNLPEEGGEWQQIARTDSRWSDERFIPLQPQVDKAVTDIGSLTQITCGIATLADPCFILPAPRRIQVHGEPWIEHDDPQFPGHVLRVPERFAPRLLKLTKSPGGLAGPRILCPYREDGALWNEAVLRENAPGLLDWLARRRAKLDQRDKGKTELHEAWYAYGRRQGLWKMGQVDEPMLAVAVMGRGALMVHRLTPADLGGRFLFTSGFLVRAATPALLDTVEAALQAPAAWAVVEAEGKAWAGKGDYRTFGARALRRIPVPPVES